MKMKLALYKTTTFAVLITFFWTCKPKIMETSLHAQSAIADSEYQYALCRIFRNVGVRWTHVCLEYSSAACKDETSTAYSGADFIAALSIAENLVMTRICKRFEMESIKY